LKKSMRIDYFVESEARTDLHRREVGPDRAQPLTAPSIPSQISPPRVRQQLGLRLVPSKATIDLLIADRAEKVPTAN
jgi:uncharacterized protein (TIGR03435 family)